MDSKFTNARGEFKVMGSESELTPIDPELRIYHDCNHRATVYSSLVYTILQKTPQNSQCPLNVPSNLPSISPFVQN